MNNIEFVQHIMTTGSPLNQLFVLDALDKWSKYTIKNEKEVLEKLKDTWFNGEAWVEAAHHVQACFNQRESRCDSKK